MEWAVPALCDIEGILDGVVLVVDLDVLEVRCIEGCDAAVAKVDRLVARGRDFAAVGPGAALVKGVGAGRTTITAGDVDGDVGVDKVFLEWIATGAGGAIHGRVQGLVVVPVTRDVHVHAAGVEQRDEVHD